MIKLKVLLNACGGKFISFSLTLFMRDLPLSSERVILILKLLLEGTIDPITTNLGWVIGNFAAFIVSKMPMIFTFLSIDKKAWSAKSTYRSFIKFEYGGSGWI